MLAPDFTTSTAAAVLAQFPLWQGEVAKGFSRDFLGSLMDIRFAGSVDTTAQIDRHVAAPGVTAEVWQEEYFEVLALLESVLAAKKKFVMMEVGAGYGRWLVRGACAVRTKRPDLGLRLIGVEAEPKHFEWLEQHFRDNTIDPKEHRLLRAAVNATGLPVPFTIGHAEDWYGQSILPPGKQLTGWPEASVVEVVATKLSSLLMSEAHVDLVDMDIQGTEEECIPEAIREMTRNVARAFVGTHSQEIHRSVGNTFREAKWELRASFSPGSHDTPFGKIQFQDGVQYWVNPNRPSGEIGSVTRFWNWINGRR